MNYVLLIYVSVLPNISLFLFFACQMSPASGLVSILKKRRVCVDNMSVSASSEARHDNIPAKRRVHFKVPEDGYEHGVFVCLLPISNIGRLIVKAR